MRKQGSLGSARAQPCINLYFYHNNNLIYGSFSHVLLFEKQVISWNLSKKTQASGILINTEGLEAIKKLEQKLGI